MTMTLAEFLSARLADQIATAREVQALAVTRGIQPDDPREPALRLARTALAECEAKRRIVEMHDVVDIEGNCAFCIEPAPCEHLRALAMPYADHDDYDEEWKP